MQHFALALVVCALVGCGGEDEGPQSIEDFVDPALLEQAETEYQRSCLIGGSITFARAAECGVPVNPDDAALLERCLDLEGEAPEMLRAQADCYEQWAFGSCEGMRGAADDPCTLVVE